MSKPWMPFYVADYLADTGHLTVTQHGAYLLLIMHYWRRGSLPVDDSQLAQIARMTADEWTTNRGTIAEFFGRDWRHQRIEDELSHAAEVSEKRRASAEQKHSNSLANAEQKHPQSQSPSQSQKDIKISGSGSENVKGKPRHGAVSKDKRFVYFNCGTAEWMSYAADYRAAHDKEPIPNSNNGRWFRWLGEAA